MHTLSLSLLTLASFLLSIAAGPLAIRDAASNVRALASDLFPPLIFQQKPICTGDFEDNVTMQSHCVGALGATCGFVVVFPDSTQSGNKDNCGNACSCTSSVRTPEDRKDTPRHLPSPPPLSPLLGEAGNADVEKNCPALPFNCADPNCAGNDTEGCVGRGPYVGCPCSREGDHSVTQYCPNAPYTCSDPDCAGYSLSAYMAVCGTKPLTGCPCLGLERAKLVR